MIDYILKRLENNKKILGPCIISKEKEIEINLLFKRA